MKKMSCQIEQVRNKVHIKINKHWHIFTLISFYIKKNKLTFKIYRRSVYFIIERWKHHESGRLSDTAAEERITEGGGGGIWMIPNMVIKASSLWTHFCSGGEQRICSAAKERDTCANWSHRLHSVCTQHQNWNKNLDPLSLSQTEIYWWPHLVQFGCYMSSKKDKGRSEREHGPIGLRQNSSSILKFTQWDENVT